MKKLPSNSIRLLCCSQVITSPSTVVKELVENALDAGATTLDVKLQQFGLDIIEVRDNGCGIKQSDTEFMGQQYYTSKISKYEDLHTVETYGFRGEALGSLCQVADVCIITRTADDPVAVAYNLDHDGKVQSTKVTHEGVGTTVVAANLFKNFPVRKQCFQTAKKSKEELKKVEDILMAYGLINPEVRIALKNNKNLLWQKNKSCDLKTALAYVFGIHTFSQLEYFESCDKNLNLNINCYVPKSDSDPRLMWRSSDEKSFIFVNKRYVIWKELSQILRKQCVSKNADTNHGKHPVCVVSVCLPSQDVDANLEPNKTKVVMNHKKEVLGIISNELCKIYNGDDSQSATEKIHGTCRVTSKYSNTTISLGNERSDLDCGSEVRIEETSAETVLNKTTSLNLPGVTERLSDVEFSAKSSTVVGLLPSANSECLTQNDGWGEPQNTEDHGHNLSDSNSFIKTADNCTSTAEIDGVNENHVLQAHDCLVTRTGNSSFQSDKTSNSRCNEKRNENCANGVSAMLEKQDGVNKNCDLDELLDDFINDSDLLDDSLLGIDTVQPNLEQWSKGRNLTNEAGKEMEPMKLLRPGICQKESAKNNRTPTTNGKRKHASEEDFVYTYFQQQQKCPSNYRLFKLFRRLNKGSSDSKSDQPNKKNKKRAMIPGQSLLTTVLQSPRRSLLASTRMKTKEVSFSLSELKQSVSRARPQTKTRNYAEIQLIKRLDPWGVWLVHKEREIFVLNPFRMQELLLYKKLLATHVLPREKLEKAIILDEKAVGSTSRYLQLKKLVITNNQDTNSWSCDDERLVSNGFEITRRHDQESGEVSMSLVKINTTIPYFGLSDLSEVLDLIKDNEKRNNDLSTCRPSKVCAFLKDEVTRICRSLTSRMTDKDILELLKKMQEQLMEKDETCVHDRPLFYPLMSY